MESFEFPKNHFGTLREMLIQLIGSERNFLANSSNFVSLIYHNFDGVNWVGFYFASSGDLVLGPHQGKSACVRIPIGSGVCGTAVKKRTPIIVDDVHRYPGYIPCDPTANSEMVVPVLFNHSVIGVFDLDSPIIKRFTTKDAEIISDLLNLLISKSVVKPLLDYYAKG
jgi:GAF domain-containing protein